MDVELIIFNTEVLAIQTAINSKMDTTSGTTTGQTLINPILNTSVSGSAIKDEDDMSSNSATHLATQQSIKAYVDAGTITFTNKTLTAPTINGAVGGTATSQTITTLTTTNVDGILGANTPAAVTGTTITANSNFVGNIDYDHQNNAMVFDTDGGENLRQDIESSGGFVISTSFIGFGVAEDIPPKLVG